MPLPRCPNPVFSPVESWHSGAQRPRVGGPSTPARGPDNPQATRFISLPGAEQKAGSTEEVRIPHFRTPEDPGRPRETPTLQQTLVPGCDNAQEIWRQELEEEGGEGTGIPFLAANVD